MMQNQTAQIDLILKQIDSFAYKSDDKLKIILKWTVEQKDIFSKTELQMHQYKTQLTKETEIKTQIQDKLNEIQKEMEQVEKSNKQTQSKNIQQTELINELKQQIDQMNNQLGLQKQLKQQISSTIGSSTTDFQLLSNLQQIQLEKQQAEQLLHQCRIQNQELKINNDNLQLKYQRLEQKHEDLYAQHQNSTLISTQQQSEAQQLKQQRQHLEQQVKENMYIQQDLKTQLTNLQLKEQNSNNTVIMLQKQIEQLQFDLKASQNTNQENQILNVQTQKEIQHKVINECCFIKVTTSNN
ncbi:Hypothetical_protein [Hexamita inflata]|uniref:Hypothetical_protein n=1 Tax=Hexamita inflata TaxID=28002 RepID=A0AA86TNH7_9EUKA|nr:Hypothetical protein HINF_LOCUS5643 [Hexamita inflata]